MRKGLFLDRDGVINREIGRHVYKEEEFELLEDIPPFLREAMALGFCIVIVSNQSGIAKGLYDHATVQRIHEKLRSELEVERVQLTDIYYAPHHPDIGNSLLRKPGTLMLEKAMAEHNIDPKRSLFFGDKETDKEAGERVGVRAIRVPPNTSLMPYLDELRNIE